MKKFTLIKSLTAIIALLLMTSALFAQMPAAIEIDPPDATVFDELTLYFDPAEACFENGSLAGVPKVYMHSGVTIGGDPWQKVVEWNGTGQNGQEPILMPVGTAGRYSITYTPADYYGIEEGTIVTQITAVFQNGTAGWEKDGRDWLNEVDCTDFLIPVNFVSTDPTFTFKVNMSKAMQDGIFTPGVNELFVDITDLGFTKLTDADLDNIYEGKVEEGLTLDETYIYKFTIDQDVYEDNDRTIVALAGNQTVDVWWNDDMLGQITFQVDMQYQDSLGTFDPATDFVDIAGSMNDWNGSGPMTLVEGSLYEVTYQVIPGEKYEYKFRINGDWATSEFPDGGPNRITIGRDFAVTQKHIYDNYNPYAWPVIFEVDMNTEITEGRFDPETEFLDFAGDPNGWGAFDYLWDRDFTGDGIYTTTILVDTGAASFGFKFRINGDWGNSEFPEGGPNRSYTAVDTAGGVVNLYVCTYNVANETYNPYVYGLSVDGDPWPDQELIGVYTYFDPNADPEGATEYQWYIATDETGSDKVAIEGETAISYIVVADDYGKYLVFGVKPVSQGGKIGEEKFAVTGPVVYEGIDEEQLAEVSIFPNPVEGVLYFTNAQHVTKVEVYNIVGQGVISTEVMDTETISINTSDLNAGIYFVVIYGEDNATRTAKIVKR